MRPEWVEEVWKQVNIIIDNQHQQYLSDSLQLDNSISKVGQHFSIVWSQLEVCLFVTRRMWTLGITFVKALSSRVPRAFANVFSSGFLELDAESNRRKVRLPPLLGSARA